MPPAAAGRIVPELLALGVSHKTAPLALRERVALAEARARQLTLELLGEGAVREVVALSTCNRTEIYLVANDPVDAESAVLGAMAREAQIRPTELSEALYVHRNCDAARHLFRVTAGLDSMIIGESEVQGQVRRAYELARESGTTGPLSDRMFNAALAAGKRARSETAIGASQVSVSSIAVELARAAIGDLHDRHVVVLGAGETSELTTRALAAQGVETIFVANRRLDRAVALAQRVGGRAVGFDDLPSELARADMVLASTASPHAIVGAPELAIVMAERPGRPLLMIDIAVPRDIDPECADVPGVTLYDIDDIQTMVARNRSVRQAEARHAAGILEEEIQRFALWLGSLDVTPTITALRARGSEIVERVLADNAGRWESVSSADLERIALVARTVVQRLLHEPTLRLRRPDGDRVHARIEVLRELFGLDDVPSESEARADSDQRQGSAGAQPGADTVAPLPSGQVRPLPVRGEAAARRRRR